MSIVHPVVFNPVVNPLVGILNMPMWKAGASLSPVDSILHYDADIDGYSEQTGGVHTFEHSVLSPQYQRNADGSYSNVGAKPAVDVIDGFKGLRSCGAVTNLLASGCTDFTGAGWVRRNAITASLVDGWYLLDNITATNDMYNYAYTTALGTDGTPYNISIDLKQRGTTGILSIQNPDDKDRGEWSVDLSKVSVSGERITEGHPAVAVVTPMVLSANGRGGILIERKSGPTTLSVYVRNPQITLASYPVPYVPPGVTQPASNATTTGGSWFALPQYIDAETSDGQYKRDGVELVNQDKSTWLVPESSTVENDILKLLGNGTGYTYPTVSCANFNQGDYVRLTVRAKASISFSVYVRGTPCSFTTSATETTKTFDVVAGASVNLFRVEVATNFPAGTEIYSISLQKLIPATQLSPLWQALDGKPDGVELVKSSIGLDPGWVKNGDGSYTFTGPVSGNANLYNIGSSVTAGQRYRVSYRIVSNTFSSNMLQIVLGTQFSTHGAQIFASNAIENITNVINAGSLKTLTGSITIDNISIQRIASQPLTLATRVRMGAGSGDLPNSADFPVISCKATTQDVQFDYKTTGIRLAATRDGTTTTTAGAGVEWSRNVIIRRITQVNTAGTQFRVGYMIEGTHTAIQWGSWANYDGSFNPSTLYRLMLGFNNSYPMWFNKITAWGKQATDAEILEAMA